ncbi:2-methylcitrate dehydratase [Aeropyrum pernix K1]|uniref:2-methylcitrate dehydratase n=1 Tax=Aeropyrum pernix (strain ATCC 700893 / DSM 11879 / JCM 9820 / NBRC 100138 / K1) TaxID=272557 RepID=Q9Y9Z2_AERPE|nr:MmgE/PrpD family protein [Aeropyrum pernix]BAA81158.2 2-methylcitrate dehydratase [Aeropyrum pernix K1]
MGETVAKAMARWVHSLRFSDIPSEVVEEVKKRVVDTAGVAVGAFNEEPVRISRSIALGTTGSRISSLIWGTLSYASADQAAFTNGCAARYFDFNDTYLSKEALHPSDTIPALVAAAEIVDADGKSLIEGIVAAYEIAARLADSYSVRSRGWDHTVYIGIASAAGAAKILGLDEDGIEHAINIAVTTGLALRQTRAGELSMWKGCAAAHAARNGLFSALLAWKGMTGPSPVFEGKFGFFKVALCGDKFELAPLGEGGYKVMQTSIKYWPVEYHSMSAVEAALKLREKAGDIKPDDIESVEVETFTVSYKIIVEDPEKWDPKTRETADHSLPYIVAAALLDGKVWLETFKPERFLADDVRKVMKKMSIRVNPKYDEIYPEGIGNKVIVRLRDGRTLEEESIYPPGHFKNPLDRSGVEAKFTRLLEGLVTEERRREFLKDAWNLENLRRPFEIFRSLTVEE